MAGVSGALSARAADLDVCVESAILLILIVAVEPPQKVVRVAATYDGGRANMGVVVVVVIG